MRRLLGRKLWVTLFAAAALCTGGGIAFAAQEVVPTSVTPEWTSRPVYLATVTPYWASDGSKSLTAGSYGQVTLSRAKNISSSNYMSISARNSSGDIAYPATLSSTGRTVTYFQNNLGGTVTFNPSMKSAKSNITSVSGTWRYYELG